MKKIRSIQLGLILWPELFRLIKIIRSSQSCVQRQVKEMNGNESSAEMNTRKPELLVFDIDHTLWPFHVDTDPYPPLKKHGDGKIRDRMGRVFEPFPGVADVLQDLYLSGQKMAVVSRTEAPPVGEAMLKLLDWNKYFQYKEIYPGRKTTHFKKISEESGIDLKNMLFFDDEYRNIRDMSAVGVICVYIRDGEYISRDIIEKGLKMFAGGESDK